MKVLLAGATGAIGRPLTRMLVAEGHEVLALARSEASAQRVRGLGAEPVHADALDREGLLRAVEGRTADAVVHQLTALKAPKRTLTADDPSNVLRAAGTEHLLEAAGVLGATRFVAQSLVTGYGYRDHGDRMLTERDPFGVLRGTVSDHVVDGLTAVEGRVFAARHVAGTALRYGVFHGPGTWFDPDPSSGTVPVPVGGGGVMSWVHVEDAAAATVAALEHGGAGEAYNIVDDAPATWGEAAGLARGGRRSPRLPGWLLRRAVPYLGDLMLDTALRVSHAKATAQLGWTPRRPGPGAGRAR
ncbi:NAD(P)-dependent oxidoreductase [Streptomyces globosus]|uniref:NAD(P)-dependent oxidoreductase n=1 Tax=Streptomyces globosus TaxID=68209 RepID=A0A344U2F4_9ACTN|nr:MULTISPECIES: NAD(P)-dependent oxidoreductase [Streptomyces]AXE25075.1 NAD(P)-dependent oxidoreductase [Streptomyces globosus]